MNDVFWIKGDPPVSLAIVLCPQSGNTLLGELLSMKESGIHTLVSLLEKGEASKLGLAEEAAEAEKIGLRFLAYPIPDAHTPQDPESFREFVAGLADRLRAGERIGIHCRGCIGRAPVTIACALIQLGWKPMDALTAVQRARGLAVPETQEQEDWILRYRP